MIALAVLTQSSKRAIRTRIARLLEVEMPVT